MKDIGTMIHVMISGQESNISTVLNRLLLCMAVSPIIVCIPVLETKIYHFNEFNASKAFLIKCQGFSRHHHCSSHGVW